MATIVDTSEIAETQWGGDNEPGPLDADISATHKPEGSRFEFHVQMRNFTMDEMDNLVVEAAARLIVGHNRDRDIAKAIEAKCIAMIDAKASEALEAVTAEIIDAPITPSFGEKKPGTMRELIGLYGREYLTAHVDNAGKPQTPDRYHNTKSRIEYLVSRAMDSKFERDMQAMTSAAIVQVRNAIQARHVAVIEAEKKRFSEALTATLAAKST